MKSLSECVIFLWVLVAIDYTPTEGDEVRVAFGSIVFVLTVLLHLIVFYGQSSRTVNETRAFTGTR